MRVTWLAGKTAGVKEEFKTDGPVTHDGEFWWQVQTTPGMNQKYGGEKRISAYLNFNVEVGETFTMRELRDELGADGVAEDAEQLNRRLRNLRPDDWVIPSYKDDRSLAPNTYRLEAVGTRVWLGERNKRDKVSATTRRLVLERDSHTCAVCAIGAGEEYDEYPGTFARMTMGHRVPGQRLGGASVDDLQTECAMCNEPIRDQLPDPETFDEVLPEVRGLKGSDLREIRTWLQVGRRSRSKTERIYGRVRRLGVADRVRMSEEISRILGE